LSLSGGARIASDRFRLNGTIFSSGLEFQGSSNASNSDVITPFAALRYRFNDRYSWYASYADVYLTESTGPPLRADGSVIGPSHGVTEETGIKAAWREGALNGSLAVYRIRQSHQLLPDDSVSSPLPTCCYLTGTAHSRGAELQIDGALAPGWLIGSGYTYNLYESGVGGIPVTVTPRHLLKIWTSKRLSDALSRWTAGGTLRAQTASRGSLLLNCTVTPTLDCVPTEVLAQKAYAVLDLRAGFDVTRNWEVALSVNNVFDKNYYLSQNSPGLEVWYGEPRNLLLRVDAKF
jgi:outer membrane receptor for ferric coprogen and ferric-rhodotorulic acid